MVVDRELPALLGASAVVNDHRPGMEAAVEHLIDLGHRRIALITGLARAAARPGADGGDARRSWQRRPEPVDAVYLPGSFSAEHGAAAARQALASDRRPTAIIAGGNQLLIGVPAGAARTSASASARDVSLVTCDDVPLSELYEPPIASIERDTVGLGRVAAELLIGRLVGGDEPRTDGLADARSRHGHPARRRD